ncbi:hypothetical protein GCM10007276_06470 [Agaricicola taiwanensis]|uniref:Uncharacterized protein n=1 Tax=Agaricicola taiwanensis TaxID=591372 RepID=A0A8J2YCW3_9RHOB|nr:hypothetical protein [Agaricicola taiwanensis]GGE31950.1 hypothetical protein GCM10007276_06470 [Agaricicola taiwanensis]
MNDLKNLVQTAFALHGIDRPEARFEEIAIETNRLLSGLASIQIPLDYYDEPSNYAALMRKEADRG